MKTRIHLLTAGAFLFLLGVASVGAQEVPSPEGHWEGAIVVPGGELGINVDLAKDGDTWSGDISIPLQQTEDFPLSNIVVDGSRVTFSMAGVPGDPSFDGTISQDGQTISGSFTQGGQNLTFSMKRGS